jgi:3D (Asp-Asp-Asp) domain-containing protein
MRIIRIVSLLAILFMPITPKFALAATEQSSNETQIKFNIKEDLIIENGVIKSKPFVFAPYIHDEYQPVKTAREMEIEKIMERFRERRENSSLPDGQFIINASAYTAAADECGKSDGITASGIKVMEGETIACPPQFPFGTKINISGMGTYMCQDRGGAIKSNHIDIYMETKAQAFSFGRQNLLAQVVK